MTALDADSKLIGSYLVGGRDAEYADAFMVDLAGRLMSRVQLTTEGHKAYLEPFEGAFGADVDYAMLVKMYGAVPGATRGRYSPADARESKKRGSKDSQTRMTSLLPTPSVRTSRYGCR